MTQQRLSIDQAMELASRHVLAGNYSVARKLYQQILNLKPENETARRELEQLPPEEGSTAATSSFNSDMREFLDAYSSRDLNQNLKEVQRLCDLYGDHPLLLSVKGAIFLEQDRYGEAQDAIKASIKLAPNSAEAWVNLGSAQAECNEPEQAVSSYQQALKLDQAPGLVESANRGLGKALAKLGHFAAARQAFEQVLSLQPSDTASRVAYAGTLLETAGNEAATTQLRKAMDSDPSSVIPHLELGKIQMAAQDYEAAKVSIENALALAPGNPRVHHRLGQLYGKMGQRDLSIKSYRRSLELEPGSAEVRHLLDAVEGNPSKIAPPEYVEDMFDDGAANFEKSLVDALGYTAPTLMLELISSVGMPFNSVLDLGCGTGLVGELLRDSVERMDGIDLSARMLDRARNKGIYDNLKHGDIVGADSLFDGEYDLVVSSDVLTYFGELALFMDTVLKRTRPGSLLCISTELLEEEGDYKLLSSGRYSHSMPFVNSTAENAGFKLLQFKEIPLRKEEGEWLTGGLYLFCRG